MTRWTRTSSSGRNRTDLVVERPRTMKRGPKSVWLVCRADTFLVPYGWSQVKSKRKPPIAAKKETSGTGQVNEE
jgi:hypothetical protein